MNWPTPSIKILRKILLPHIKGKSVTSIQLWEVLLAEVLNPNYKDAPGTSSLKKYFSTWFDVASSFILDLILLKFADAIPEFYF